MPHTVCACSVGSFHFPEGRSNANNVPQPLWNSLLYGFVHAFLAVSRLARNPPPAGPGTITDA